MTGQVPIEFDPRTNGETPYAVSEAECRFAIWRLDRCDDDGFSVFEPVLFARGHVEVEQKTVVNEYGVEEYSHTQYLVDPRRVTNIPHPTDPVNGFVPDDYVAYSPAVGDYAEFLPWETDAMEYPDPGREVHHGLEASLDSTTKPHLRIDAYPVRAFMTPCVKNFVTHFELVL